MSDKEMRKIALFIVTQLLLPRLMAAMPKPEDTRGRGKAWAKMVSVTAEAEYKAGGKL